MALGGFEAEWPSRLPHEGAGNDPGELVYVAVPCHFWGFQRAGGGFGIAVGDEGDVRPDRRAAGGLVFRAWWRRSRRGPGERDCRKVWRRQAQGAWALALTVSGGGGWPGTAQGG